MKQPKNKQTITPKQIEILTLIYRLRFLNRSQIQTMLGHKNHRQIYQWLNDLVEQKYLVCQKILSYSLVYSLALPSRKVLLNVPEVEPELLKRIWREKNYSDQFRTHCLVLVDINLSLIALTTKAKALLYFYTRTDLYEMEHLINPLPDGYFCIKEGDLSFSRYFIEIFEILQPKILQKRINNYFYYYQSEEWQNNMEGKEFPKVLIVCPSEKMKRYLNYFIGHKLEEDSDLSFYLTTREVIKNKGITSQTLQKVQVKP